ncbi:phosphatidylserine lipase ABHD16A [Schistocerca americana]|uniref:phosphatidylserine lipase ABHD16A n=1 Tax=Schistocerca americana TaxID=7009 RepID=UPI001F4FFD67|nr:phosphatidylserine lipase ABHD16A [Schistocerca americana]XP_047114766.1 phosphatidylserine lipase ABHD16A [Schistocerca piceifrons]XP_049785279.1 phosphatidylserine lipase ABHD16A [Schistocerca cancellata]XP_049960091.1 phosphatidylserine lipase ABHD16A [Schistocerca serialis cubense]
MAGVRLVWQCMFTPKLYKVYSDAAVYEPGQLEKFGDQVINSLYLAWNFGIYTSPIVAAILHRKGLFVVDGVLTIAKFITGLGLVLVASYFIRGIGRANNQQYIRFVRALNAAKNDYNKDTKKALSAYDFDFYACPVDFRWTEVVGEEKKFRMYADRPSVRGSAVENVFAIPCHILTYIIAHTFGVKLMYPGSMKMMQYMLFPMLLQGRTKLITEHNGQRYKLKSRDGNEIDTMFVDNRNKHENGSVLILCSEGNAGFYEIGIMTTPIEAGYSVLGWNHPGFAGSTGAPYPPQELHAVDIVMQFALHKLGFMPENIVLFGWSIGGYATTWAAMNYPDVKGVILDATFDDVMTLAVTRMPQLLEPIIRQTIRNHLNLNNYQQLARYPGAVLIIRRTEDEVICTEDMNLASNRGNHLLLKLLKHRYPLIVDNETVPTLIEWLSADSTQQSQLWNKHAVDESLCTSVLLSYIAESSTSYPMLLGEEFAKDLKIQMTLFLASKYMIDFRSSHCTQLPTNLFRMPWDLSPESDYVKI